MDLKRSTDYITNQRIRGEPSEPTVRKPDASRDGNGAVYGASPKAQHRTGYQQLSFEVTTANREATKPTLREISGSSAETSWTV